MTIDWQAFVVVALVSIGTATVLVALFSLGLRLLAVPDRGVVVRAAAYACFVVAALGTLYGVYLLIPSIQLH